MKKEKNLKSEAYEKKMEKKRLKKEEEERKELEANIDKDEKWAKKSSTKPWKLRLMMIKRRGDDRGIDAGGAGEEKIHHGGRDQSIAIKSPRSLGTSRKEEEGEVVKKEEEEEKEKKKKIKAERSSDVTTRESEKPRRRRRALLLLKRQQECPLQRPRDTTAETTKSELDGDVYGS